MGDHKITTATLGEKKPEPKITERRNWKNYSKNLIDTKTRSVHGLNNLQI